MRSSKLQSKQKICIGIPGGSLPLEVVSDARESPSEKHPKTEDLMKYQKTVSHTGQFPHFKLGGLSRLHIPN